MAAPPRRLMAAGLDGVEIVASHGYLPAQFLNPRRQPARRTTMAASLENRLRFLREVARRDAPQTSAATSSSACGSSGDEQDSLRALELGEVLDSLRGARWRRLLDYVNVIAGTSASLAGAVHIVPPMAIANAYVAPFAAAAEGRRSGMPVFVAGRINQPQIAEQVIAAGQADMCGMTRAMICDPEMPDKAEAGAHRRHPRLHRLQPGLHRAFPHGLSDLLHPASGDRARADLRHAASPRRARKRVLVAGGGPAGMKAAAVAAERGHRGHALRGGAAARRPGAAGAAAARRAPSSAASSPTCTREMELRRRRGACCAPR